MSTVKEDLAEGTTLTRRGNIGYTSTRIFNVTGVAGAGEAQKLNAVNDAGLPNMLDVHPNIPLCYVREITVDLTGPATYQVRVFYSTLSYTATRSSTPDTQIAVGATALQETLDEDYLGLQQLVYDNDDEDTEQTGEFSVFLPQATYRLTRRQSYSPLDDAKFVVGKVNDSEWRMDPGSEAREWLCIGISGDSNDNGQFYTVTYEFLHATSRKANAITGNRTWDSYVTWRDPTTGNVPPGLKGTDESAFPGWRFVQTYAAIDFDFLELDFR